LNILLLIKDEYAELEEAVRAVPGLNVFLHSSGPCSEVECAIVGRPEEWDWQEFVKPGCAVLLITKESSKFPFLPFEALTEQTLLAALGWARQRQTLLDEQALIKERSQKILAQVTHELRSPITVVSLAGQLAMKEGLSRDKLLDNLGMIRESAKALETLVNDILDYSKMASGKLELSSTKFDLHNFVTNICDGYRLLAEEKGVSLVLDVEPGLPTSVKGDPGRLRQILVNLLSNAVKFTEKGSLFVSGRSVKTSFGEVLVEFSVRDTGIGIPEESVARIFEPYEQAEDRTFHQYGGTGLGLSIVKWIVEQMGGSITVSSRLGEGSSFTFRVPLGRVRAFLPIPQNRWDLQFLPVLVLQKPKASRQLLCKHLRDWGCEVWGTGDELEAFRLASVARQGLLLISLEDWGFEFVEQLCEQSASNAARVVLLTKVGQRGDAARSQELGVRAYLTGELDLEQLKRALELVLTDRYSLVTRHTVRETSDLELVGSR